MHLFWDIEPIPLVEVRVTVEVITGPSVPWLYFWALQAGFQQDRRRKGAGHFGLQHHPDYPDQGAVNWGGYHEGGGELPGAPSPLGSALGNANTSDYRWVIGRPYQYRIHRSPNEGWRGSIIDLGTGSETVVRDLWIEATHLVDPMVWSEVFAPCDAPSTTVEWRGMHGFDAGGRRIDARRVRVNYQGLNAGGCTNTTVVPVAGGVRQVTNADRSIATGSTLDL